MWIDEGLLRAICILPDSDGFYHHIGRLQAFICCFKAAGGDHLAKHNDLPPRILKEKAR